MGQIDADGSCQKSQAAFAHPFRCMLVVLDRRHSCATPADLLVTKEMIKFNIIIIKRLRRIYGNFIFYFLDTPL
jgi:hypothetical protein